jgi:hAT family C-terminal dimerisation region
MDGLKETNELDDYLSQAIEKVTDPIKWWWDHRKVFPKLSAMAFDFLSVPGMFLCFVIDIFSIDYVYKQRQLLLNVSFRRADICFISPGIA